VPLLHNSQTDLRQSSDSCSFGWPGQQSERADQPYLGAGNPANTVGREREQPMITMRPARSTAIAALGAHCDDIAIGAGATLLFMCSANPGLRIHVLVLSGGGTAREDEEHAALAAFCPGADLRITVLKLQDGRLPAHWEEAKGAVEDLRGQTSPDLLLAPNRFDAHQDHRGLAELVPTAFRDHLVLGYEIIKWDGDLGRPSAYQPLDGAVAEAKADLLWKHYPSQRHRPWYDREAFLGLARIRGIECGSRYAEAYYVNKIALDLSGG
jgi:LmbE family N-acetylglucosaminyl deacetylase